MCASAVAKWDRRSHSQIARRERKNGRMQAAQVYASAAAKWDKRSHDPVARRKRENGRMQAAWVCTSAVAKRDRRSHMPIARHKQRAGPMQAVQVHASTVAKWEGHRNYKIGRDREIRAILREGAKWDSVSRSPAVGLNGKIGRRRDMAKWNARSQNQSVRQGATTCQAWAPQSRTHMSAKGDGRSRKPRATARV